MNTILNKRGVFQKTRRAIRTGDIFLTTAGHLTERHSAWIALQAPTAKGGVRCEPVDRLGKYLRKTNLAKSL